MRTSLPVLLVVCSLLVSCAGQSPQTSAPSQDQAAAIAQPPASSPAARASSGQSQPAATLLDPGKGQEIGYVYEAFLSPHQEPGEEKDTPAMVPSEFRSTAPSLLRNERQSRGYGLLRFTSDLSKVYVDVKVEGVKAEDVNMFHIHCGRPDMLGPILVDFALAGSIQENLADGVFSVEITDEHIEKTAQEAQGLVGAFTIGCPIVPGLPDKVKTIAGMEYIARQGELYFNLHTKGQTYFGDMRGQIHPVAARQSTAP